MSTMEGSKPDTEEFDIMPFFSIFNDFIFLWVLLGKGFRYMGKPSGLTKKPPAG